MVKETDLTLYGLIGFPLGHSWSAEWFNERFRRTGDFHKSYHLYPLEDIREFPGLLHSQPLLGGLNVTIPYKEQVIPLLDELDPEARAIGAVNTIRIYRVSGKPVTKGFNTDAPGFLQTLTPAMTSGRALVLGTGGASRAVAHALAGEAVPVTFVSRLKKGPGIISCQELTKEVMESHPLIVNATPIGMYPEIDDYPPIPYHFLNEGHFLYDLVYNPEITGFIKQGMLHSVS